MNKKTKKVVDDHKHKFIQRDETEIELEINDFMSAARESNYVGLLFDIQKEAKEKDIDPDIYERKIFGSPYGERLYNDVIFYKQEHDVDWSEQEHRLCKKAYADFLAYVVIPQDILMT